MADKLIFGSYVTVICMSIVFLVLIGLMYVIKIQRAIVEKLEGIREEKVKPQVQETAVSDNQYSVEQDDEEIVAVITAAVAAVLGRPTSYIKVRSIRRLEPAAPSWSIAGRQDQINNRF